MYNNKKCAEYFRKNEAYERCFKELRKKWESYGRAAGRITLKDASKDEQRAIGGIVSKIFLEKDITFTFAEFEEGLQKTRFAPIQMKKVLELYFGEEILTNQEKRSLIKNEKELFFLGICEKLQQNIGWNGSSQIEDGLCHERMPSVLSWFQSMAKEQKYGYQLLIKEFSADKTKAESLALYVGNALLQLETVGGDQVPLAVFSAEISGNPHFFDRGSVAAQLLVHGICFCKNCPAPTSSYEWRELLWDVGISCDNIASMVHAFGVHLQTTEGLHPAYEAFCQRREACVITSENLRDIIGAKAAGNRVYVVENEMVFSFLTEHLDRCKEEITLLCTSGQLRVAAFQLLSLLAESGAVICYSGDLDPEGVVIAEQLWKKYGDVIQMWRMSPEDYQVSISQEPLNEMRLAKLADVKHPVLRRTADCILEKKYAAYQENLLECLLGDISKFKSS